MSRRVLLVDDDAQMLEEFMEIFQEANLELVTADSVQEAIKVSKDYAFDVAVVDNKLPGGNGIELIDKLKEIRPAAVYILITAYVSVESAVAALHQGVFDYVVKPFNPDELMKTVRRAVAQIDSKQHASRQVEGLQKEKDILEEKLKIVEKINEIFMDREGKIIELKKEVNGLLGRLNEAPRYKVQ